MTPLSYKQIRRELFQYVIDCFNFSSIEANRHADRYALEVYSAQFVEDVRVQIQKTESNIKAAEHLKVNG